MTVLRASALVALCLGPLTLASTGCKSSSGGSGGSVSTTSTTGVSGTTGATGSSGATAGSTTSTSGSTSSGGVMGTPESIDVTQTPCFTLATGTANQSNPCPGDLYFMTGVNVDLGAGSGTPYCLPATGMPAPAASLAAVPTDYSMCTWASYVEGGSGLANRGLIVRDASQAHHYRMHITSNTLPKLVFEYAKID